MMKSQYLFGLLPLFGVIFAYPPYSNDVYLQMAMERAKDSGYPWYEYGNNYPQQDDVYDGLRDDAQFSWIDMEVNPIWPTADLRLGQVSGVAVDDEDNLVLFHRADHPWDAQYKLFDEENNFLARDAGAISIPTVVTLSKQDGSVLDAWGENRFYMPHGLTIDGENNVWLTDVAMHQVFKFSPESEEPTLILGKAFDPAFDVQDQERFCKPTDIAVASDGTIFVADGYCNSRVVRFGADGSFEAQFGEDEFDVPHSLALAEDLDMICVADREHGRIACYSAGLEEPSMLGRFIREYTDPNNLPIYAIEYSPSNGLLFAVTGATYDAPATGFTIDLREMRYTADVVDVWSPFNNGFTAAHDVTACHEGGTIYVGEVIYGQNNIWQFHNDAAQIDMFGPANDYNDLVDPYDADLSDESDELNSIAGQNSVESDENSMDELDEEENAIDDSNGLNEDDEQEEFEDGDFDQSEEDEDVDQSEELDADDEEEDDQESDDLIGSDEEEEVEEEGAMKADGQEEEAEYFEGNEEDREKRAVENVENLAM